MIHTLWNPKRIHLSALLVWTIALLVAACGTPDPAIEQPAPVGAKPGGRILFAQHGDIYVWDGEVRRLSELGDASYPRWSEDGSRFVFVRTGDAYSDLYVADADGSNLEQLTFNQPGEDPGTKSYVDNAVWAMDPTWSPAGAAIAFISDLGSHQNFLFLMNGPGNRPERVAASTYGDNVEHPDFSPEGTKVVFAQRVTRTDNTDRATDLKVVDLNTGQVQALAEGEQGNYAPAWSPDGDWITFVRRTDGKSDIWVAPAGGGDPVQLTQIGDVTAPAWSPDSRSIAFLDQDANSFHVSYMSFSVGPDGVPQAGKPQELFSVEAIDAVSGLSWAP